MEKPKINLQGKVIIEYDYTEKYYYIMFPEGDVWVAKTKKEVESYCKRWAKNNQKENSINILSIEYRDCPTKRK